MDKVIYVYWMNIGIEENWLCHTNIIPRITINKEQEQIIKNIDTMCLLLKHRNDIVILHNKPSKLVELGTIAYGNTLDNIFIPKNVWKYSGISQAILDDEKIIDYLKEKNNKTGYKVRLIPYAVGETEKKISRATGCELIGANTNLVKQVNNKIFCRNLAKNLTLPVTDGYECFTIEEIEKNIRSLLLKYSGEKFIVKDAYGASGKGIYLVKNEDDYNIIQKLLHRAKRRGGNTEVLVEHWYEQSVNINYQLFITTDYQYILLGITQQIIKETVYQGSEFPINFENSIKTKLVYYIKKVAEYLKEIKYTGFVNVDAIITKDEIYPLLEINGRMSLSTYLLLWYEHMKINRQCRCIYYDLPFQIDLERLEMVICEKIYSIEKKQGIIPYVYCPAISNKCKGRIFVAIIGDTIEYINNIQESIYKTINL